MSYCIYLYLNQTDLLDTFAPSKIKIMLNDISISSFLHTCPWTQHFHAHCVITMQICIHAHSQFDPLVNIDNFNFLTVMNIAMCIQNTRTCISSVPSWVLYHQYPHNLEYCNYNWPLWYYHDMHRVIHSCDTLCQFHNGLHIIIITVDCVPST